uniref:EGF-like domain-containing protein n=1 Tax=Macrostomum lignano TaxID=282301 RepID=A0A1I8FMW4_9PLAT
NLYPDSVVRFLTPGDWYLTLANDQQDSIAVERTHWRSAAATGYLDRGVCRCTAQWKGPECEVPWSECPDPLCSGNGRCQAGRCECFEGFGGDRLSELVESSLDGVRMASNLTPNHVANLSRSDLQSARLQRPRRLPGQRSLSLLFGLVRHRLLDSGAGGNKGCNGQQRRLCEGRGRFVDGRCQCFDGYSGDNCARLKPSRNHPENQPKSTCEHLPESCTVLCQHGRCRNGQCSCDPAGGGVRCNLRACDPLCEAGGHARLRQRHLPAAQRLELGPTAPLKCYKRHLFRVPGTAQDLGKWEKRTRRSCRLLRPRLLPPDRLRHGCHLRKGGAIAKQVLLF